MLIYLDIKYITFFHNELCVSFNKQVSLATILFIGAMVIYVVVFLPQPFLWRNWPIVVYTAFNPVHLYMEIPHHIFIFIVYSIDILYAYISFLIDMYIRSFVNLLLLICLS